MSTRDVVLGKSFFCKKIAAKNNMLSKTPRFEPYQEKNVFQTSKTINQTVCCTIKLYFFFILDNERNCSNFGTNICKKRFLKTCKDIEGGILCDCCLAGSELEFNSVGKKCKGNNS